MDRVFFSKKDLVKTDFKCSKIQCSLTAHSRWVLVVFAPSHSIAHIQPYEPHVYLQVCYDHWGESKQRNMIAYHLLSPEIEKNVQCQICPRLSATREMFWQQRAATATHKASFIDVIQGFSVQVAVRYRYIYQARCQIMQSFGVWTSAWWDINSS